MGHPLSSSQRSAFSRPSRSRVRSASPRLRLVLLCTLLLAGAAGCADEQTPSGDLLSLRDFLGLAPERAAELPVDERARIAAQLHELWTAQQAEPVGSVRLDWPPADSAVERSRLALIEHDRSRAEQALDPSVVALTRELPAELELSSPGLGPEQLGLTLDGLWQLEPLAGDETVLWRGFLEIDPAFGQASSEALGGVSEAELAERLEPLFRRYLGAVEAEGSLVRVVALPRAPIALWYAADANALLVNPNLLYLFAATADAPRPQGGGYETRGFALSLSFVEDCVDEQLARCSSCTWNAASPTCAPLFAESTSLASECGDLGANDAEGFRLYCYGRFLELNDLCFAASDPLDACGASSIPALSMAELEGLRPMLDDETCQRALLDCENERSGSDYDFDSATSSASGSGDCASECAQMGCEALVGVLVQIACQACIEGVSESSGCSADSEQSAAAPPADAPAERVASAVALASPFALLGWVAFAGRRRRR